MSSEHMNYFTKDNLDSYLKELAKEYRRLNGKGMPAEIILIGGAAILASYGFRDMTTDVDAVIRAASSMDDAINHVGDKFGLPNGWLNADFIRTASYSPKLVQYSEYYRTYSNVLSIRVVTSEYLIAMKLRSGRKYKNDLSDVIGILAEHEKHGKSISMEDISKAVENLYGGWDSVPADSQTYIKAVMARGNYSEAYSEILEEERHTKNALISFEQDYPGVATTDNVDNILNNLKAKTESKSAILEQLRRNTAGKNKS